MRLNIPHEVQEDIGEGEAKKIAYKTYILAV
jgi:hypothetical protein